MINLKKKLGKKEVTIGSWLQINSSDVAEIMAKSGFEWLVVDMEHGSISVRDLPCLFRAIENGGACPLVRLSENNSFLIKRVLDAGAKGIIVPMVKSVEEVKNAISAAKYPPEGIRGIGYSRANEYGNNFTDYFKSFNENVVVIIQIENIDAVKNIDNIFSVKGVDGFIIGPYDLSGSMNKTGKFDDQEVVDMINKTFKSAVKHDIVPGMHVIPPDPEEVKKRINGGFKFIAVSIDGFMLISLAVKTLKRIKELL